MDVYLGNAMSQWLGENEDNRNGILITKFA